MTVSRRHFLQTAVAGAALTATDVGQPASARAAEPRRIRIGQVGTAHAHATKLSVYRDSNDYEVVGIVEPDSGLRRAAEGQAVYQGLPWMTLDELLRTDGLQAVLVETRVRDLISTAQTCVDAGLHVHVDKPAGDSVPQLERLLDAARSRKRMVQMGYMYRYNPGIVLLRKFLKEGWLGDIFEVHAVMSKVVPPQDRTRLAEFPGGMMFELGCHLLDLVVGLFGEPQSVRGYARHSSALKDGLVDNMLAVLEYPGMLASVKTTALEVDGGSRRHLVVCGTEGTFQIQPLDNPSIHLTLARPQGGYKQGTQTIALPKYVRYVDDALDMARVIRGEKATDFPYEQDLAVQRTLLAACGQPVG